MKCALIAPPWPIFNRPSIQIAALSAYLKQNLQDIECNCFHPYLTLYDIIGPENYGVISESSWASEAIGAMVFSTKHRDEKAKVALDALRGRGVRWKFEKIYWAAEALLRALEGLAQSQNWDEYALVGITVSLNQLMSGLYLAKRIKEMSPSTKVIMGGASVSGLVGQSLLDEFNFIDAIIIGEGELSLLSLVKDLKQGRCWRRQVFKGEQIADLNVLPIPDYDDYFKELTRLSPQYRFTPTIPIEFSRGCFWGRCVFCNLNIQWRGYRQKSHVRMKKEIGKLLNRYRCIDFAFMDNALPPKESIRFFSAIGGLGLDLRFFGELRAAISRNEAEAFSRAGLKSVQVGIESLSDTFLSRMKKGRSVIENLAAMRHLLEAGISLEGNLILDFPGTQKEEVEETLENLKYAKFFKPLKPVSFWLGYGSPVFLNPSEYGIKRISPHKYYSILFPEPIHISPMIYDYIGTMKADKRKWQPVRVAIKKWHAFWEKHNIYAPPLTYRDGGSVLVVRQVCEDGTVYQHKFTGTSRSMFLDMLEPIELDLIFTKYDNIPKDRIMAFLRDLMHKHIVYSDGIKALALPVRQNR